MTGRSYTKHDIITFGRHLIHSGDLDPVYVILQKAELSKQQLHRWLIAYWCFYNTGVASWMSEYEGEAFWEQMMIAAKNLEPSPLGDRWGRGKERRHFRGVQATRSVDSLMRKYPVPEDMLKFLCPGAQEHFKGIMERVKLHYGFGHWIAFKICDMLERVLGYQISFDEASIFMFKDPEQAAMLLYLHHHPEMDAKNVKLKREVILRNVTDYLQQAFGKLPAPPGFERNINIQEIETVLCKWKSHWKGHYPLNNDLHEVQEGLMPWVTVCPTAEKLLAVLPQPMDLSAVPQE